MMAFVRMDGGLIRGQLGLNPVEIWDYFRQRRVVRRNLGAVLRMLYLECLSNIELLKSVAGGGRESEETYFPIIDQLETKSIEYLFLEGEGNTRVFRSLSQKSEIVYDEGETALGHRLPGEIRLMHVLIFLHVKINFLRKFATMRRDVRGSGRGLRRVRVRVRLENIRLNLEAIVKVLEADRDFRGFQARRFLG